MNRQIESFLRELKETTGKSFVYRIETWAMEHSEDIQTYHELSSNMRGFTRVSKDSEQGLIDTFDLIRSKVRLIQQTDDLTGQIETKIGDYAE